MDWKSAISELQAFGMTQPQIAAACGCQQTTISALATGKTQDPRDSLGQKLRTLLATKRLESAKERPPQPDPVPGAGPGPQAVPPRGDVSSVAEGAAAA